MQREKSERHNFDVETSFWHQKQGCAVRGGIVYRQSLEKLAFGNVIQPRWLGSLE